MLYNDESRLRYIYVLIKPNNISHYYWYLIPFGLDSNHMINKHYDNENG